MSSLKRLLLEDILVAEQAYSMSRIINLEYSNGFALVSKAIDTTPSNFTFTPSDVTLSLIIKVAHGCLTALKVRFTTTGTLPGGISLNTDYYLIRQSADLFRVANSVENALAANFITLTNGGSGTHTVSITAATSPVITLEASIDGEIYAPISGINVPLIASPYMIESEAAYYHYLKVSLTVSSGQFNINSRIMSKGQQN